MDETTVRDDGEIWGKLYWTLGNESNHEANSLGNGHGTQPGLGRVGGL